MIAYYYLEIKFLARCQALSADLTGDRIKNAAAGAAIV